MSRAVAIALVPLLAALALLPACWRVASHDENAAPDVDVDADSDTGSDTGTDVDTDTDTDTDSDSDTDTGTDVDTDTDADADTATATDSETDTGGIACDLGTYEGDLQAMTQDELEELEGYTSISGFLSIVCGFGCTDLSGLSCLASAGQILVLSTGGLTSLEGLDSLTSVEEGFYIEYNDGLTNLLGLEALTTVGGQFAIHDNGDVPDCEVCDVLGQLTSGPSEIIVNDNLDDSCTPVPENCP